MKARAFRYGVPAMVLVMLLAAAAVGIWLVAEPCVAADGFFVRHEHAESPIASTWFIHFGRAHVEATLAIVVAIGSGVVLLSLTVAVGGLSLVLISCWRDWLRYCDSREAEAVRDRLAYHDILEAEAVMRWWRKSAGGQLSHRKQPRPACGGADACHGAQRWCDDCGDVSKSCDSGGCDVHSGVSP